MSKKVFSVTIDEKILSTWKKYTEEECINSSKIIERMLTEYLESRKRSKK